MTKSSGKKKLTRGEKWILVAPLFFAALFFGVIWFRNKTKSIEPRLVIVAPPKVEFSNAALSPDGKYVVAIGGDPSSPSNANVGSGNGVLRVYDAHTGQLFTARSVSDFARMTALAISSDSSQLACGRETTKVLSLPDANLLHDLGRTRSGKYSYVGSGAGSLTFSPDDRLLVSGGGAQARLWDTRTGTFLRFLDKSNGFFKPWRENFSHQNPRFSPNGKLLAAITTGGMYPANDNGINEKPTKNTDGRLQIWDVATGKLLRVFPPKNVIAFAFSPDSSKLVISTAPTDRKGQPRTYLYNSQTGQIVWTSQVTGDTGNKTVLLTVPDVAFAPDGKTLACQDEWGRIIFYDTLTGQTICTLLSQIEPNHWGGWMTTAQPQSLAFSKDGKTLFSRHENTIYLWHTDDWNIQ